MRAESLNNSIFSFKIDDNNISEKQITNYNDVNEILSQNKDNKMKILYLNKTNIHKILYDAEETIKISSEMMNNDLSNFFYLILLIEDNPNIINYEYPLDLIRKINNKIKNGDSSIFIKILKYKIIIELIKNYKGTDNYEKEQNEELEKIEKDNRNSIELQILKELEIENIKKMAIDEIYISIIIMLIKTINNYEYTINIIKDLYFENIDLTILMVDKLSDALNNKEIVNKYKILEKKDFEFNEEIINFYYILFKYILKKSTYLNNINIFRKE